jgi:hypothetical protein
MHREAIDMAVPSSPGHRKNVDILEKREDNKNCADL